MESGRAAAAAAGVGALIPRHAYCSAEVICSLKEATPAAAPPNARRQKRAPPTTAPLLIRADKRRKYRPRGWGRGGGNSGRARQDARGSSGTIGRLRRFKCASSKVIRGRSPLPERVNNEEAKSWAPDWINHRQTLSPQPSCSRVSGEM